MANAPMSVQPARAHAVPYLGVLASLQLIDPSVATTALLKVDQVLAMQDSTLALAASLSTLAQPHRSADGLPRGSAGAPWAVDGRLAVDDRR
jgi:hypothetical protein